jgi:hypothetical protein
MLEPLREPRSKSHIERYIYRPIDKAASLFGMNEQKSESALSPTIRYRQLKARLAPVGWISEGYVQNRGPGAGGPCYQWTRKRKGKTVSVALSREQFEWLQEAIINWRQVQQILKEMQQLSRQVLFTNVPNPNRRKRLGKRVLGLI